MPILYSDYRKKYAENRDAINKQYATKNTTKTKPDIVSSENNLKKQLQEEKTAQKKLKTILDKNNVVTTGSTSSFYTPNLLTIANANREKIATGNLPTAQEVNNQTKTAQQNIKKYEAVVKDSDEYKNYKKEFYETPVIKNEYYQAKVANENYSNADKILSGLTSGFVGTVLPERVTKNENGDYVNLPTYSELKNQKIYDNSSTAGKLYNTITQSIGSMIPSIVLGTLTGGLGTAAGLSTKAISAAKTATSLGTMFLNVTKQSSNEKILQGYSAQEANQYGLMSGAIQTGTELLFGGLGKALGTGALDEVVTKKLTQKITNKTLKILAESGISSVGEGVEEVIGDLLYPIAQKLALSDKRSYGELLKNQNILEDLITGILTSVIMQAPRDVISFTNKENNTQQQEIQTNKENNTQQQEIQTNKENNTQQQEIQTNTNYDTQQTTVENTLKELNNDTSSIMQDTELTNNDKINRINNEIDILNDILTTDVKVGTLDIESIYNQKQDLIKQREEIAKTLTEEQKIETVKSLSTQITEIFNADTENITPANMAVVDDKVQQVEKMTKEVEKDKKIKVLSNKQKIQLNSEQYINEASGIINNINMNIPEGQKRVEIVTELNQEQRQIMDLGAVFGKQIIFTDNMPQSGLVSQNNPNILFIDNKATSQLVTNKQATNLYVMGHELFHSLKQVNPETYTQFTDYLKQNVTIEQIVDFAQKYDPQNANELLNSIKIDGEFKLDEIKKHYLKYKNQNAALDYIVEEMTANEFGGMITDGNYMNKLYESNKSLFDKVVDAIRELFKSLTGSTYDSSLTQLQVEKIRNDFENIVNEIGQTKETTKESATTKIQENKQETKQQETEYRYHNTSPDAIKSISKQGLLPNEGQYGKGVYFAPTVEGTEAWHGDKGAVLRVDKNKLDSYGEFTEQGWNENVVPSNLLEVSYDKGKTWKPLIEKETKKPTTAKIQKNESKQTSEYQIPETLYRSTNSGITTPKSHNVPGAKFYSTKQEISARYSKSGETKTANIVNAIKNPLIIEGNGELYKNISFENKTMRTDDIVAIAKERGYDGVIFKNIIDTGPVFHGKIADPVSDIIVTIEQTAKPVEIKQEVKKSVENKEEVKPGTQGMKTTQMDMGTWFDNINKMYDKYVETKDKDRLKSVTNAYENYKKKGGTEVISELDSVVETKTKADFKAKLKEAGLDIKSLPKSMPLVMRRKILNREIVIPEGMSLGEAINEYKKDPTNKRFLAKTINPVSYAKDVTPTDIGNILELNRVEQLNIKNTDKRAMKNMFGKGLYFSLNEKTTQYYEYNYKDANTLVDKYDVNTKNIFVLPLDQIYDNHAQYLPGRNRYEIDASTELSKEMIKQGLLTEKENNKIMNSSNSDIIEKYNDILKENGYKGIAIFVHPTDMKNNEVTFFGGSQLVLFDKSKAKLKESTGTYGPDYNIKNIKYLPKNTASQRKESQFYSNTAVNSPVFKSIIASLSKNEGFRYYSTVSHKTDFNKAVERIQQRGDAAITDFMATKSFDSVDSAMAKILIEYYQRNGDVQSETNVAIKVREAITQGAQVVESAKIFKNTSPASMLLQVETDLNRAYESLQDSGDPIVRAWLNENANGITFTEAEKDWLYQNFNKLNKLDVNSREYVVKHALIQSFVANKIPKNIAQKVKAFRRIAMLFNPKTMGRNMLGNIVVVPAHRSSDRFSSYLDAFLAKQTGIRTTGNRNVQAYKEGRARGLQYAKQDFELGINTDASNAFEKQAGKTWKDSDLKGAGKVLNYMEKWMNYGLDIGDRPFFEAYYENSLANQMRLNNITEPTQSMIEIAQAEAAKKTWKNNGKMVQLASTVRRIGNRVGFKNGKLAYDSQGNVDLGLGDIILPFIMTPANLAVAVYDYSPAAFASVYRNAKTFNNAVKSGKNVDIAQKTLVDSFGRASTGVVLFAIAYVLANAGLISGGEDEDKDVRALMKAQGYQPYSIKIGDTTFSYDWAQPIANPFAIMAELNRQSEMNKNNPNKSDEANNMFKAVSEAFTLGADRLYEQSFLQSLKNIFSAETPQEAVINFTGDLPASFVPTLFKQIADTIDGNVKATYDKNNLLTSMFARAAVKIPVLKSTLPTKKDVLGNNIELFGGENNIFNTMFNPANVSKDKAGDVGKELSDVYIHTGEKAIMPQVAVKYIDYDTNGDGIKERITFDNKQQSTLQGIMGKLSADTVYEMLNNSVYQNASYDDKATALTSLVQYAKAVALRDSGLVPNYEIKSGNAAQIDNYTNQGLSIPDAVMYDSLINPIKSLKNNSGETIQGSENGQKAYTIMNMQVSDNSKNTMLKLISPLSKNPETVSSLSKLSTVQQYIDYYSLSRTDYTLINKYSRDDYDISTQYFNIDGATYTKFANEVSEIRADVDANGNVIANSKKNKVFEYINSLPLNQYQKLYLFSVSGYSIKSYSNQMFGYINSLDISADEKRQIWTSLGLK